MAGDLIVSGLTTGDSDFVSWESDGWQIVTIAGTFDSDTVATLVCSEPSLSIDGITSSEIALFSCTEPTVMQVKLSSSHKVKIATTGGGVTQSIYATKRKIANQ